MKIIQTFSNAFATFLSQYCFNLGLTRFALPQADHQPCSPPGNPGIQQKHALPVTGALRRRECQEVAGSRFANRLWGMTRWGLFLGAFRRKDWPPSRRFFSSALWVGALLLTVGIACGGDNSGEDWPRFLGPRANGTSLETGLIDKWTTNGPPLVWEKKIGTGYGAPSILGNRLVLHHRVGAEEIVECFDAAKGESLWHYNYPSQFVDPYGYNNGPPAALPCSLQISVTPLARKAS